MAQWKRAGPITQRSEDQNLALLVILLSIKIFKGRLLPVLLFSTSQIYRIYSIKRPGRLFNFWTFRVGAYSRWALIRSWALLEFSPFLFHLIYTFLRAYDGNEVYVKVTGSKTLENGLIVPYTFKTRTPNRTTDMKFEWEILRLKELSAHMDISVKTLRKIPTLS